MGIFSCVSSPGSVLSIFVTNCDMSEGVEGSPNCPKHTEQGSTD